ncbi:MAG: hypothetical protein QFX32_07475 [Methanolinea sp.]|nr:hypothetical protein [Methanolinea sp.]
MIGRVKEEIELMRRHVQVLRSVVANQPIGIMKLSELLELPSHRIRYSLRVLEKMGYIQASSAGAVATRAGERLLEVLDEEIDRMIALLVQMKGGGGDEGENPSATFNTGKDNL